MAKGKKKVPALNASSMADISFLLLIFFLVTTSMDVNQGLARRLPAISNEQVDKPQDVNRRNFFYVKINSQNELLVQGEPLDIKQLREKAKEFIENPNNASHLPVKVEEDIPGLGLVSYTKDHIISVQNDVDTQYQMYLNVQNELVAAYNELRDDFSKQRWGKVFNELDEDQQKLVQKVYAQRISEAEPKNYGGNK